MPDFQKITERERERERFIFRSDRRGLGCALGLARDPGRAQATRDAA